MTLVAISRERRWYFANPHFDIFQLSVFNTNTICIRVSYRFHIWLCVAVGSESDVIMLYCSKIQREANMKMKFAEIALRRPKPPR